MKKIIAILLLVCLTLSLSGCRIKKNDVTNNDKNNQSKLSENVSNGFTSDIRSDINSSHISGEPSENHSGGVISDIGEGVSDIMSDVVSDAESLTPTMAKPIDSADFDFSKFSELENEAKGWGPGRQVDNKNRPVACDTYQKKYGEFGGVFIMPETEKVMYLTFDEGYEFEDCTSRILDTLKEKDVKAIFFITLDYATKHPELVSRMIDEGHIVGNHTAHHKLMPNITEEECVNEIVGLHNYVVENFNYEMTLFRPPEGLWSTKTMAIAKELGYKTVLWSFAYKDWETNNQMGVDQAFPRVAEAAHPGAVYLLHAVSKDNVKMLPDLIDYWEKEGYQLKLFEEEKEEEQFNLRDGD